ncbi:GNAT family N-acetyltransferase [Methylobacter sp.]|uniref:GNAT family N-acetyltransferase n=1 Tax=Methylobacter sp. TaxID=2051955 RepID=UPI003FA5E6A0
MGRLAIDVDFQGRRLSGALLWDAIIRALRSEVAVFALVVDAKDDHAEAFYRHHGFTNLDSLPQQLILPLTNIASKGEPLIRSRR